ncbi:unnamed protein product [Arctia plantaginis]|uniref:Uncharacterized protein n=1 Tax=Arctia plantaginis TaxID=874455 RepID=A0A8S1BD57_ARCPL|nr:unnamed protein product [Arctia plantaginis]
MTVKFVVLAALVAVAHSSVVPIVRVDADSSHFSYEDPAVPVVSVVPVEPESPVGPAVTSEPISSVEPANSVKSASPVGPAVTAEPISSVEPANSVKSASPVKPVASVAPVTFVVSSEPSVVDYRNYAHIFYAGGPVTTVYSSIVAPSPYSVFVPSVYGVPAAFAGPLAYW